jgi:hypothetical protein
LVLKQLIQQSRQNNQCVQRSETQSKQNTHRHYIRREKADPRIFKQCQNNSKIKSQICTHNAGYAPVKSTFYNQDPNVTPHTPAIGIIPSVVAFIFILKPGNQAATWVSC